MSADRWADAMAVRRYNPRPWVRERSVLFVGPTSPAGLYPGAAAGRPVLVGRYPDTARRAGTPRAAVMTYYHCLTPRDLVRVWDMTRGRLLWGGV